MAIRTSRLGQSRRIGGLWHTSAAPPIAPGERTLRQESYGPDSDMAPLLSRTNRLLMFGKYQRERGIRRKHAAVIMAAARYDDCLMARPVSLVHVPVESDAAGQSGRPLCHRRTRTIEA